MTKASTIVIIKIGAIGDIVMSLPMLLVIKHENPACKIVWIAGRSMKSLLASIPQIDELIFVDDAKLLTGSPFAKVTELFKIWMKLMGRSAERVLIGHSNRAYRSIAWVLRSGDVRSFGTRPGNHALPSPLRHHSTEYVRLATNVDGSPLPEPPLYRLYPRSPSRKIIGLAPGGAKNLKRDTPHRRWPVEHYAKLAATLCTLGYTVRLYGGTTDSWVEPAFQNVESRIGKLTLEETARELAELDLFISHDSGPAHLASLSDIPQITLFGPTSPLNFAPLGANKISMSLSRRLPCQPCYDGLECAPCPDFRCMTLITVEEVALAAERALR